MPRPKLILIDGHALAYQQFFALPVASFTTGAGEPTNATYGFARTLLDILDMNPEYLAVSFDQGMTGRDTVYSQYKGTREKMDNDLVIQMNRIRELVTAFNIPILELDDTEADDVIGTVARQAEQHDLQVEIYTGDRDLLQLVTDRVFVNLPARKKNEEGIQRYDTARVIETFGIQPTQIPDYKGLVGDASDNIPGVKGIGDKTAAILLQQYPTLKSVYDHLDEQKAGLKTKLSDGRELAFMSKMLATIKTDLPIQLDLKQCVAHDYQREKVADLFRILEFRRLIDRLPKGISEEGTVPPAPIAPSMSEEDALLYAMYAPINVTPSSPPPVIRTAAPVTTVIVDTPEQLSQLVAALSSAPLIAFDTETTGTDSITAALVGISLAVDGTIGYYIPVGHRALDGLVGEAPHQLPLETVINALRPVLTNPYQEKVAHNAHYDLNVLYQHGIEVFPVSFDTMIAEWVLNPDSRNKGLKNLAWVRLNAEMTAIDELIGRGRDQITMDRVPIDRAAPYAAADAVMTFRLVLPLKTDLEKVGLYRLFKDLEVPLIPVLASMHRAGVRVDLPYLRNLGAELDQRLDELRRQIHQSVGMEFNIASLKQLNEVLFDKLKLPSKGLSKTIHGYSLDAEALEGMADKHPMIPILLEWRSLEKLKNTYVDALLEQADSTERVHTVYNQTGAITGRLSSENPNLQNIPTRTEEGRRVRRAFIAKPGYQLISVDYSQIELRILAHFSGDPFMTDAFARNQDIHAATAAAVFNIPYEQVTKDQRYLAKRINFGLMYGMGAFRLGKEANLSTSQATEFIRQYFARLPKIEQYLRESKEQAVERGYLETLFGRRRRFDVLQESRRDQVSSAQRASAEREAINMPVQGTNADIIKKAMIELFEQLRTGNYQAQLLLQVHDELVLEVPDQEVSAVAKLVQSIMGNAARLSVPLATEAKVGDNWRDMTPV